MSDSTLNERVAEEIRVMIARRNITASELARRAGMTQRSVSRRITGEKAIDMDDLQKFAAALDVQIADLIPRDSAHAADKAYSTPLPARTTHSINRPRHLPIRCATRPAPTSQMGTRQLSHSGHGDRRPVIQPWTDAGVTA